MYYLQAIVSYFVSQIPDIPDKGKRSTEDKSVKFKSIDPAMKKKMSEDVRERTLLLTHLLAYKTHTLPRYSTL